MSLSTPLLSSEQVRKITKGRTPLLPAEYELALQSLRECSTLDETKYWDDKASALAAWAKIYHSDEAMRQARILKLHAYRRMADLTKEMMKKEGRGATETLKEKGLSPKQVQGVMAVGRLPQTEFDRVTTRERIPSPTSLIPGQYRRRPANAGAASIESLRAFHYFTTRVSAESVAQGMGGKDKSFVLRAAEEVMDWLEELIENTRET